MQSHLRGMRFGYTLRMASETIVVRRNPLFAILKLMIVIFIFSTAYSVFIFGTDYAETANEAVSFFGVFEVGLVAMVVITLLEIVYALLLILQWTRDTYSIHYDEIIHRSGLFSIRERHYALKNIENIFCRQTFLGRLLNYGTIQLQGRFLKEPLLMRGIIDPLYNTDVIKRTTILSIANH